VEFPQAADASVPQNQAISGHLDPGTPDFVYVPVVVPPGVAQLDVSYSYDRPTVPAGVPGNAMDIGVFDERGIRVGERTGFRGWSGGARTSFSVSNPAATPGYLPGPVRPGTWHVALGPYTIAPQGLDWTIQVTLTYGPPGPEFTPDYPPVQAAGRGRAWYRGDCHLHTIYSDGKRTPEEVAAGARAAGLDFINTSEHNTSSSHAVWGQYASPDLLVITGEEATTRNGHYVIVGLPAGTWIDWRYRARDGELPEFLRALHRDGAIAVAAHPFATCLACSWKFGYAGMDAVEVWNGPWTPDDEVAVQMWNGMLVESARTGQWLPAMGDSDAHSDPQVIGLPHNVVLADDLNTAAVLDGLKAGRTWIAESSAVNLTFTAGASDGGATAGIGERLRVAASDLVTVTLEVSGVPNGTAALITDEGQALTQALDASGAGTVTWQTTPAVSAYVRAEVRHPVTSPESQLPAAMAALTNPIFLGQPHRPAD
jgi:predicted metal-dependent phosphoesterase TrpH